MSREEGSRGKGGREPNNPGRRRGRLAEGGHVGTRVQQSKAQVQKSLKTLAHDLSVAAGPGGAGCRGVPPQVGSGTSSAGPQVLRCRPRCRAESRARVRGSLRRLLPARARGSATPRKSRPGWAVRASY